MRERPGATTWADMCGGYLPCQARLTRLAHAHSSSQQLRSAGVSSPATDHRKDTKEDDLSKVIWVEGGEAEIQTQT